MDAQLKRMKARRARARGMTLIEGMIAAAVIGIGMVGIFGGIVTATRQNAIANRLNWGSSIADQVKNGLAMQGRSRLTTGGGLFTTGCATDPTIISYAGGLNGLAGACVIDLDGYDAGVTNPSLKVVPGYEKPLNDPGLDGSRVFKRVLVRFQNAVTNQDNVMVVVSFNDAGRRHFVKKFIALFNNTNTGAETGLEM